jgi:hypothetical protein
MPSTPAAHHAPPRSRDAPARRGCDSPASGVVVDGLLTIRGEESPLSLATTLTQQADGHLAVHATGTFDRMGSALRKAPRWVIASEVQVVVDAVLQPAPEAR